MNVLKNIIGAAVIVLASGGALASDINVDGVVWDPDKINPNGDFTGRFTFYQVFTSAADAVDITLNDTIDVDKGISPGSITTGAVGVGDELQGVVEFLSLNGSSLIPDDMDGDGGGYCPTCELTGVFGGFTATAAATLSLGWMNVYVDSTPDFNPLSGPLDFADAADGTLWLSLEAVSTTFITGGFPSGELATYWKVTGGAAAANFDTDFYDGLFSGADLFSSANAAFKNDDMESDGDLDHYATANGIVLGNTIPEPTTVAIFGLGLLGLAGVARRKSS